MTSIVISGRPNSELTSQCILLSEELCKYFPTVKVIKVLKHPEEWNYYSEEICKLFGFQKESHPLIYFSNGFFLGDKDAFFNYVEKEFNIKYEPNYQIIYNLTQENIKKVNNEYTTRIKGQVLREKVSTLIQGLDFNDDYNALNYDYELTCILGMKIFYKYDEKFTPKPKGYEIFLNPIEKNQFEVDLKTNKVIEKDKDRDNSQLPNMSLINTSKDVGNNVSSNNLNNPNVSMMSSNKRGDNKKITVINNVKLGKDKDKEIKDREIKDKIVEKDKDMNNTKDVNEEEEDEEESIKKKTYYYNTYKQFNIPKVAVKKDYIIESNVS
jgi:hypothetical protein